MSNQAQKQKQASRWGSFLSGAVAGLESRLDTILAEDDQASVRLRAAEQISREHAALQVAAGKVATEQTLSRANSRARANGRLQDKLAKAMVKNPENQRSSNRPSSELAAQSDTPPLIIASGRTSTDSKQSDMVADSTPFHEVGKEKDHSDQRLSTNFNNTTEQYTSASLFEDRPSIPASPRHSHDSTTSQRPKDPTLPQFFAESMPNIDPVIVTSEAKPSSELEIELSSLRALHEQTIEEQKLEHTSFLERIDALQSKLTYLTNTLSSYTSNAEPSTNTSENDRKLAEKDAKIAGLMEEGQNLSKTELKHTTLIKKLRIKVSESDRETAVLKQKLAKAEQGAVEAAERATRAEAAEKAAQEKLKVVARIERDVDGLRMEREAAGVTVAALRKQLAEAEARAKEAVKNAHSGQLEARAKAVERLEEELTDLRIEKKLAEDRAKSETRDVKEQAARQAERAKVAEVELKGEIANLETKLELLRSQTEETTTNSASSTKLLRQIETLQTQYSLASENWQGIESMLTSRVAALEKERDDITKRESESRRKARDVNSKARKLEDELDSVVERAKSLEVDIADQRAQGQKLQSRLVQAETALQESRENRERERKVWEAELTQKIEEEKLKWRLENQPQMPPPTQANAGFLRGESPSGSGSNRKGLFVDSTMAHGRRTRSGFTPHEAGLTSPEPPTSRRSSVHPAPFRQDSAASLALMNGHQRLSRTPSINPIDDDDAFDNVSSPQRTIADIISVGPSSTGPSIQLVERLSTNVRRLEYEKSVSKEEMARLTAQRDEAREEVVSLMREIDDKRAADERIAQLEKDLEEMNQRYQTTLEMFGEKSEQVEELQNDVADLKKIYKDLVSTLN